MISTQPQTICENRFNTAKFHYKWTLSFGEKRWNFHYSKRKVNRNNFFFFSIQDLSGVILIWCEKRRIHTIFLRSSGNICFYVCAVATLLYSQRRDETTFSYNIKKKNNKKNTEKMPSFFFAGHFSGIMGF